MRHPVPAFLTACAAALLAALPARAASPDVVISQVYGGGGSASALYNADYVELHNRSGATVDISGWSLQYAAAASNFSGRLTAPAGVTIPAGRYLLVQLGATGGAGQPLPVAPDITVGTFSLSATSGKVALVRNATLLPCGATGSPCLPNAAIADYVGYGAASEAEGTPVNGGAALNAAVGALRPGAGCIDNDNNTADFQVAGSGTLAPRDNASLAAVCTYQPLVTTTSLPDGEVSRAYSQSLSAANGLSPYAWTALAGLPPGLTLSAAGVLSGTPSTAGGYTLQAQVTDASGAIATAGIPVTIQSAISIPTGALPDALTGAAYNQALPVSGGVGPFVWALTGGSLPPGLQFATTGTVYGVPSALGNYSVTVQVTDSFGAAASRALAIATVNFGIVTPHLPAAQVGVAYPAGTQLQATGGLAPYYFAVQSGPLPPGLSLALGGTLSGTPTQAGSYPVTFRVNDSNGLPAYRLITMTVGTPALQANWSPRGLYGGELTRVHHSPSYAGDGTLFASANAGEIYRSTDRGQSWTMTVIDPTRAYARLGDLLLSPVYNQAGAASPEVQTVFALSLDFGVMKSVDHGASFAAANAGISCYVSEICQSGGFVTLAISPAYASDHTLFATVNPASGNFQVFKTTTGGASWSPVYTMTAATLTPTAVSLSPNYAVDQTLFMQVVDSGSGNGFVYRSTNGGTAWSSVAGFSSSTSGIVPPAVVVSPAFAADGTVVVLSPLGNLYRSTDGGSSFTALPAALRSYALAAAARPGATPRWLLSAFQFPSYLLASEDNLVTTWPLIGAGLPRGDYASSLSLSAPAPPGGAPDIAAGSRSGMFLSADDGGDFAELDRGIAAFALIDIAGQGGSVAIANSSNGWLYSETLGTTSTRRPNLGQNVNTVALSPDYANDRVLFLEGATGGGSFVFRSPDGGQTMAQVLSLGNDFYSHTAIKPGFSGTTGEMYWTTGYGGVQRSVNGGQNFSPVTLPGPDCGGSFTYGAAFSPNYASDGARFVSAANGLCKSVDGGTVWTPLKNGAAKLSGLFALSPGYLDGGANGPGRTIIIADFNTNKTYRSADGGATWAQISGVNQARPWFSPGYATDGTVFLTVDVSCGCGLPGLFRSGDFGVTFARLSGGDLLYNRNVTGLYLPPGFTGGGGAPMLAITGGSGLWTSGNGGLSFSPVTDCRSVDSQITALARAPGGAQGFADPGTKPDGTVQAGSLYAATNQGVYQSNDNGASFTPVSQGLPALANMQSIVVPAAAGGTVLSGVKNPAPGAPQGIWKYNGSTWTQLALANLSTTGSYTSFLEDGTYLYATNATGVSARSADGGASWTALAAAQTDLAQLDYNAQSTPTFLRDPAAKKAGPFPQLASAVTASLWGVSQSGGPRYSLDNGASWIATPGTNDYVLPAGSWTVIRALGINAASGSREVVAGTTTGLYRSADGGVTWKPVSGTGSGLEATSKNFSAAISTTTALGGTDILVGATGTTTGGVYLSGDGGEHWTQVNAGFDPNNLSISSLIKTSCAGCPVQYYSGSFGGGLYTRTIPVVSPPVFPSVNYSCYGGAACPCATGAGSGPEQGGQAFKLCGSNFQAGAVVEFDGMAATGCAVTASAIGCTGTPPHAPGPVSIRVRNPDTRIGYLPAQYSYVAGSPRASNLLVVKATGNAALSWNCPAASCTASAPARVYRSQNALFSLYVENYNGGASGAGGAGTYSNTGAIASAQSYFWSAE